MNIIKLDDQMYNEDIIIVLNATNKQFSAYYKKKTGVEPPQTFKDGYFITVYYNKNTTHFIYFENFSYRICDYGLLAHEMFHCVSAVFRDIGIGMSEESEEAWAYYLQHLYSQALSKIVDKLKQT